MLLSLAPIALLVLLLSASVALFGSDASYGPNQVALIIASAATMLVGWRRRKQSSRRRSSTMCICASTVICEQRTTIYIL